MAGQITCFEQKNVIQVTFSSGSRPYEAWQLLSTVLGYPAREPWRNRKTSQFLKAFWKLQRSITHVSEINLSWATNWLQPQGSPLWHMWNKRAAQVSLVVLGLGVVCCVVGHWNTPINSCDLCNHPKLSRSDVICKREGAWDTVGIEQNLTDWKTRFNL